MRPDRTDADAMPVMVIVLLGIAALAAMLGDSGIARAALVGAGVFGFLAVAIR